MKKITPRHIIFKLFKTCDKEKILKAAKEKKTYSVQRSKDKDDTICLVRNSKNKKTAQQNL